MISVPPAIRDPGMHEDGAGCGDGDGSDNGVTMTGPETGDRGRGRARGRGTEVEPVEPEPEPEVDIETCKHGHISSIDNNSCRTTTITMVASSGLSLLSCLDHP
jgi:hypothetical protein